MAEQSAPITPGEFPPPSYNSAVAREIKRLMGCTARTKLAEPGATYKGYVVGFDTHVVFQKVGNGLVIHDKSRLEHTPSKATKVAIAYSCDTSRVASVVDAPKRARSQGLAP